MYPSFWRSCIANLRPAIHNIPRPPLRLEEAGQNGILVPAIAGQLQAANPRRGGRQVLDQAPGLVPRAVVDEQNVAARADRTRLHQALQKSDEAGAALPEHLLLIVAGDDDAEIRRIRAHDQRPLPEKAPDIALGRAALASGGTHLALRVGDGDPVDETARHQSYGGQPAAPEQVAANGDGRVVRDARATHGRRKGVGDAIVHVQEAVVSVPAFDPLI